MNTTTALTEEQVQEFQTVLGEIKGGWANVKDLPATFKTIQDETAQLGQQMKDVRRLVASRLAPSPRTRTPGTGERRMRAPPRSTARRSLPQERPPQRALLCPGAARRAD